MFLMLVYVLPGRAITLETIENITLSLLEMHRPVDYERIQIGVRQAASLWGDEDGDAQEFKDFCLRHFITDEDSLQNAFLRLQQNLETIYGHNHEISRDLKSPLELQVDPLLPIDYLFAEYDPFAHIQDDLFLNKIAFVILLNFPIYSLEEKMARGNEWSRMHWAQSRLADQFTARVPASISQELSRAYVQADDYIANYNIYLHQLRTAKGERLFPPGLKLITHWGLRDELKSQYADERGFERQKMIYAVMERIILQDIPRMVINSEQFEWDPVSNQVYQNGVPTAMMSENNRRYEMLINIFNAEKSVDKFNPLFPTKMDRQFREHREILENEFEALISSVLSAPAAKKVADVISQRCGRPFESFDIWYSGFKPRTLFNEGDLDELVAYRYPTVERFQNDLARMLTDLGFDAETASFLQKKIKVDPSRGTGHANGALRREDDAHLRTRIPAAGMNYKGYNIAIHELGHNVEQVFSLNRIDHYMLNGVPNNAFTEAFAFIFQSRDQELLGKAVTDKSSEYLKALDTFWATCEIAAVGLVDMRVWHWMYDHPQMTPEELKQAVIAISKAVWNEYYYPITGIKDSLILAIYSHMIAFGLYLPDYSLGHIIMFQIEDYLKGKNLGKEMERMCRIGRLTPDAWMRAAVGSPISAQPMINAAENALKKVKPD